MIRVLVLAVFLAACRGDDPSDRFAKDSIAIESATPPSTAANSGFETRADHGSWTVSDRDGATIQFPGAPTFRTYSVEIPGAGTAMVREGVVVLDQDTSFRFVVKRVPSAPWRTIDVEQFYDADRDQLSKLMGSTLVRDEHVRIDNLSARRVTIRAPGDRVMMTTLEMAVPDRQTIYGAVATWAGPDAPKPVQRFLDSFAISASASGTR